MAASLICVTLAPAFTECWLLVVCLNNNHLYIGHVELELTSKEAF